VIGARNSVEETKVAVTALPATWTCDDATNPVPIKSRLKFVGERPGVADPFVTTGSGFRIDSVDEAEATGVACVTAVIVTVFGVGIVAGGVYKPVAEIVPVALPPPATPFTCQLTAVLLVFVTAAVNCTVDPSRACAVPEIVTAGFAVGAGLPPPPEQPAAKLTKPKQSNPAALLWPIPNTRTRKFEDPGSPAVIAHSFNLLTAH
jgi:hypothetical protein